MLINAFGGITQDPQQAVARHVKKSGWRKIALAFNFDWQVSEPTLTNSEDKWGKFFVYTSTAIVTAPNGRRVYATGACSSRNPFFSKKKGAEIPPPPEDIAMMAQTVALNRAISDMVGSGEVSAEEYYALDHTESAAKPRQKSKPAYTPKKETPPEPEKSTKPEQTEPDTTKVDEKLLLKVLAAVDYAKTLGMSEEAHKRTWDALTDNPTVDVVNTAIAWLRKHYPLATQEL